MHFSKERRNKFTIALLFCLVVAPWVLSKLRQIVCCLDFYSSNETLVVKYARRVLSPFD